MRLKNLILGLLLIPSITLGSFSEADRALITARNLLTNPGAESGKAGWTVSTGSFAASTSSPIEGNASFTWDAGASTETFTSVAVAIPSGWYGQNGVVSCALTCASGTCTHTLTAFDGSNNLVTPVTIQSATTGAPRTSANFIYPGSGNIQLRLTASADEPSLKVDKCLIGLASEFNLSQVSQAQFIGSAYYPNTTSCVWARTNTAYGDLPTDSDCPAPTIELNPGPGTISTTNNHLPQITISNLPPGVYQVIASVPIDNASSSAYRGYQISDGSTVSGSQALKEGTAGEQPPLTVIGMFSYTVAQSSVTFKIQCLASSGSCDIENNSNTAEQLTFRVYRFPGSSELALRPDQTPASWSGYHDNTCSWARTNTGFGDPTADSTCVFTERTNRNFGTVTSYLSSSDKLPGIVLTPPRTGLYHVCAQGAMSNGASFPSANLQLIDGGSTVLGYWSGSFAANERTPFSICGDYNVTSVASTTFRIQTKVDSSSITIGGAAADAVIEWTISSLDAGRSAPVLVGSVTSNSTGAERVERAELNCDASSSITSQSGTWLSAIGNRSTAACAITIASGIFSATPACVFTVKATSVQATSVSMSSSTAGTVYGASSDYDGYLICMGPR